MQEHNNYVSPLRSRYASKDMQQLFSLRNKILTWRKLWLALAKAEYEVSITAITQEKIRAMQNNLENIDFDFAKRKEKELKHDVMAHIHAFGKAAPEAAGIIHLGATSCFVTDNADIVIFRDALKLLHKRLLAVLSALKDFALKYKALATLGYTHFQPAQPTTVGKRATLWLYDFFVAAQEIERVSAELKFRGVKGTTGTQASFMILTDNNEEKVKRIDRKVAEFMGFAETYAVTGQTYSRIEDVKILNALGLLASAAGKFGEDIRLLAHEREIEEPFAKSQVGSSAMPDKRNPMKCERICALARFAKNLVANAADTHQHQWLERTLDDSANRRLTFSEIFLASDAIVLLCTEVAKGLVVNEHIIRANLDKFAPFLLTEELLMRAATKDTTDGRQILHEKIRKHSLAAMQNLKEKGVNDLIARLKADAAFSDFAKFLEKSEINTGRAASQVVEFIEEQIEPYLAKFNFETNLPKSEV